MSGPADCEEVEIRDGLPDCYLPILKKIEHLFRGMFPYAHLKVGEEELRYFVKGYYNSAEENTSCCPNEPADGKIVTIYCTLELMDKYHHLDFLSKVQNNKRIGESALDELPDGTSSIKLKCRGPTIDRYSGNLLKKVPQVVEFCIMYEKNLIESEDIEFVEV